MFLGKIVLLFPGNDEKALQRPSSKKEGLGKEIDWSINDTNFKGMNQKSLHQAIRVVS
jgi:hypothetical protein